MLGERLNVVLCIVPPECCPVGVVPRSIQSESTNCLLAMVCVAGTQRVAANLLRAALRTSSPRDSPHFAPALNSLVVPAARSSNGDSGALRCRSNRSRRPSRKNCNQTGPRRRRADPAGYRTLPTAGATIRANLIAGRLAEAHGLPIRLDLPTRARMVEARATLDTQHWQENIRGAFTVGNVGGTCECCSSMTSHCWYHTQRSGPRTPRCRSDSHLRSRCRSRVSTRTRVTLASLVVPSQSARSTAC